MKIRTRLTLWYAAILFVSLAIISYGAYQEIWEVMDETHIKRPAKKAMQEAGELMTQIGLPAIFFGILGGWWLTRKTLKPIVALTEAVEKLNDANLKTQLQPSGNGDELDRLTQVYNAMTARLDASFMRIREFTLHASHELKTPLTVMRGELETSLHDDSWSAQQKELLLGQIDEIERLTKIVDGLSLLTKADAGQVHLNCERLNLEELLQENFADAKILAQPQGIQVTLVACEPCLIEGDRHRLRQLLLNLADNAIKYNQLSGTITLSLRKVDGMAVAQITNTGPGLPKELQPRVFERFFRGDQSHSRNTDGCGLGLSIAQWIVRAHRGELSFDSIPQKETTVTVRLPLAG